MQFYKYQGTGNDFVMIDQRDQQYLTRADVATVRQLCDRRFGIGADGLILLQNHPDYDFEMVYFNSDGNESSMCGNGGRCLVAFANFLDVPAKDRRYLEDTSYLKTYTFLAIDGAHEATINTAGNWVELKMTDVSQVECGNDFYYLNTGSPHYVRFVDDLKNVNVVADGRAVRYNNRFAAVGTNVNFVEQTAHGISVLTYERGVEDETLSCGTGVTAAAIAHYLQQEKQVATEVPIRVKGGELSVRFAPQGEGFVDIWLCGPAERVFSGEVDIQCKI
ncbi:MAG: diaminopimelate epimerase [Saprospiraceae bacterium]